MSLIRMVDVRKSFGTVVALKGITMEVGDNEVVGLLGDNGAGKSTLVKLVMGVFPPTSGEIWIKDKRIPTHGYSAREAHNLRIETVYQEKALGDKQSLWRNIFIGRQLTNSFGFIKVKKEKEETDRIMKELIGFRGSGVSSESRVARLSGGERQGVAIGRAMYFDADLIILDEPTVALSLVEVEKVHNFVKKIKESHRSAIYISHNIGDAYKICDRFIILDRGEIVAEASKAAITLDELTHRMMEIAKGNQAPQAKAGRG
jgi:simple sugar transport system ATP-binding protein